MSPQPKPHRVQLSRKKGWRMPENTVSVARPSIHGNPYKVGAVDETTGRTITPELAVTLYRLLVCQTAFKDIFEPRFAQLRGKNLACWCPLDQPCHADVLLEIANGDAS